MSHIHHIPCHGALNMYCAIESMIARFYLLSLHRIRSGYKRHFTAGFISTIIPQKSLKFFSCENKQTTSKTQATYKLVVSTNIQVGGFNPLQTNIMSNMDSPLPLFLGGEHKTILETPSKLSHVQHLWYIYGISMVYLLTFGPFF